MLACAWNKSMYLSGRFLTALETNHHTDTHNIISYRITHCGLGAPYRATNICVNTGSFNCLLPDGTKPLLWPTLIYQYGTTLLTVRKKQWKHPWKHYSDVIMSTMTSQITGVSIVYLVVCSDADQKNFQSSVSLAFVRGIHRWPVNSPTKSQ